MPAFLSTAIQSMSSLVEGRLRRPRMRADLEERFERLLDERVVEARVVHVDDRAA